MTPNGKPSPKLKIPCANNTCGFDPHHRHKKEALQLVWGAFFLSAACERVEQHCTRSQKKRPDFVGTFLFYMRYILRAPAVLFRLIPPLQGVFFAARIYSRSAARHFRKRPPVLPKGRTIPEKKSIKTLLRPFIPPFLTDFTMFFMKKALQMNFKNILYNYKLSFFMQTFLYRFVWGRQACACRTASALR